MSYTNKSRLTSASLWAILPMPISITNSDGTSMFLTAKKSTPTQESRMIPSPDLLMIIRTNSKRQDLINQSIGIRLLATTTIYGWVHLQTITSDRPVSVKIYSTWAMYSPTLWA